VVTGFAASEEDAMTEDRRAYDPFAPAPAAPTSVAQPLADNEPTEASTTDDLEDMSRVDLIELAERHDVATYGSKAAIAARIREAQGNS
jgi:hypothetical protein